MRGICRIKSGSSMAPQLKRSPKPQELKVVWSMSRGGCDVGDRREFGASREADQRL